MLRSNLRSLGLVFVATLAASGWISPAFAAIGEVIFVSGDVKITDTQGRTRQAVRSTQINEGDSVLTAAGASTQIRMIDKGFIAVRPDTQMKFDSYKYQGREDGNESALMSLVKGGFRTITGIIGRTNKSNYLVRTPLATIGIRGTDHEPFFIPPPSPGQIPLAPPGAYNKVNIGSTTMTTAAGSRTVGANQVAFTPSATQVAQLLPKMPLFFQPPPAPAAQAKPGAEKPAAAEGGQKPAAGAPQQQAGGTAKPAAAPEPIRATAVVDSPTQVAAGVATAVATPAVVADPAPVAVTAPSQDKLVLTITATTTNTPSGQAATLDTNTQTVTQGQFVYDVETKTTTNTADGTTFTIANPASGGQLTISDFGKQALDEAAKVVTAQASISAISTALGASASTSSTTAMTAATTAKTTALADAATIAGIAAINTATAATNLATINTAATTAASTATSAAAVNAANSNVTNGVGGTDFRDSTAAAALTAMSTANSAIQAAKTAATTASTGAGTQSTALTAAKTSATTQSGNATTAFNTAQSTTTALTAAANVDTGLTNPNQTVANLLSLANAANTSAQSHAAAAVAAQTAKDFTLAQAEFNLTQAENVKAQAYLTLAGQIQSVVTQATSVSTAQSQLATLLTTANAAKTTGDADVTAVATQLATTNTNVPTVQSNAAAAQYSNPTIVTGSRFTSVAFGSKAAATTGSEKISATATSQPNTNYVLDGSKNLVEARSTGIDAGQFSGGTPVSLAGADVKISGGTAANNSVTFLDSSAANGPNYIALGRWTGTVASPLMLDINSGATTLNLGTNSLHWMTAYLPPTSFVQTRAGTTAYTQLAATQPTDSQGNVWTLNTASLSANFDTQTVAAGVGVSLGATSVSGSGSFAISGPSFGGNFSTITSGYGGGLQGSFAGEKATGAGFGYSFNPTVASGPYTNLIQGVVAFSTNTAPAQAQFAAVAQASADAALIAKNSINTIGTALGGSASTIPTAALSTASTTNTAAQSDATTIAGIAAVATATAAADLATVTATATTAGNQVTAATAVNTANGSFRDSTAAAGLAAMNTANTTVQGALTSATTANTTAGTQNTALTTAKTSAAAQATTASTALNTAQSTLAALTAAANVDAGATNPNQTVSNLLTLATTAATNAQTAATNATNATIGGNLTLAQTEMTTAQAENAKAQAYLALAQQIQTVIVQGGTVAAAASQLSTLSTTASAAKSAGDTAVATATSAVGTASTAAATVALQAAIAQYNNPAIATLSGFQSTLAASNNTGASQNNKIDGGSSTKPNTNYVLDGAKNLVEVRDTSFSSGVFGTAASPSYSSADVVFSGGTAADTFKATDNSLYLGRWQGGSVAVDNLGNGVGVDNTIALGLQSAHWLVALQPPANYAQTKITGTNNYTVLAKTAPTDSLGNVGVLNSASLIADFTNHRVTAITNATVDSKTYAMTVSNMPITGNDFSGTGTATCTGGTCSGAYSGDVMGAFAGLDASAAGYKYGFWSTIASGPYTDLIRGVVALTTATAPTLIPQPAALVSASYAYTSGPNTLVTTGAYNPRGADYSDDGAGSLVSVSTNPLTDSSVRSLTVSGATAFDTGTATSTGGTAVNYGRWQGGTVSGADSSGAFTRTIAGSLDWIKGPVQTPFYLGNALTGTAVAYSAAGSTPPTDQNNNTGTINTSTTILSVNFAKQAVSFNLDATIGANNWIAAATDVKLEDSKAFFAGTGATGAHNAMTVTLNGSGAATFGAVSGNLYGTGVDAAGLTYALGQGTSNFASGAVAFTGTAQSTSTNYVAGLVSAGMLGSPVNTSAAPILNTTLAALNSQYAYWVDGGVTAATRVSRDGASPIGQVYKFDLNLPVATSLGCTTTCTGVTETPGTFTVRDSAFPFDSPPSPGAAAAATMLTNTGSDSATGISWGRYVGFVSYVDRIGTTNGAANSTFDARTSNWHGIWASTQNAVPVLPTSGTATYTLLGGTNPTSNTGAVGTLNLGTTTLSADFTNKTVSAAVNLTVGGATWSGSATNMAIQQGTYFEAQRNAGVGALNVTSSIAGVTSGKLSGIFTGNATGTTGGAMVGYALNVGGAAGSTVQGVAAFKK